MYRQKEHLRSAEVVFQRSDTERNNPPVPPMNADDRR